MSTKADSIKSALPFCDEMRHTESANSLKVICRTKYQDTFMIFK